MTFDYELLTIGAGSGGVAATRRAGNYGVRAAICEEDRVGGTCVLRGCIPKKLFVYASHFSEDFKDSKNYGWSVSDVTFDWETLVRNKDAELERLHGIYNKMLDDASVDVISGRAGFIDEHNVEVREGDTSRIVSAETILVATGGWAIKPPISGLESALTSTEAFDLSEFPERMVILGGGYIAVEFAGIFSKLGVAVTEVIRAKHVLRGFDNDLRHHLQREMIREGITVKAEVNVNAVQKVSDVYRVELSDGGVIEADQLLCALGRAPNTLALGLDEAGVEKLGNGAIKVDAWSRTSVPNIYAVGDCTDRVNLTPVAIAEGRAFADTLYNNQPKTVDYENIASAVFSQPPIGTVGLTETEARSKYGDIGVYRSEFRPLKATMSGNSGRTFMKLLVENSSDRVVGCHMAGDDAAEIIQGVAVAVKCGATKAQFDSTMAIHPTASEELVTMYEPFLDATE